MFLTAPAVEKIKFPEIILDNLTGHDYNNLANDLALKATRIEPVAPEGGKTMSEVRVKEGESLENALKRFKRSCAKAGVIAEVKKREHYVSPSLKRKQKSEAARKNRKKFY